MSGSRTKLLHSISNNLLIYKQSVEVFFDASWYDRVSK